MIQKHCVILNVCPVLQGIYSLGTTDQIYTHCCANACKDFRKIQQAHLALMTAAAVGTLSTQLQGAVVGVATGIIAFLEKSRMQNVLFTRQIQDKNSSEHQSLMVTLICSHTR